MKNLAIVSVIFLVAFAGMGCTNQPITQHDTGFGDVPKQDETVPTGPLHIVFDGIYDAYIPIDQASAYVQYDPQVDPPVCSLYVDVPSNSPVHVGISGVYSAASGNEVVPLDDFYGISASVEGNSQPFDDVTVAFSSQGIHLDGVATIDGTARAISLDGPIYRGCARLGPPPGWTPPSPDPDLGASWSGGVTPPVAWVDPDFGSPECEPFR